MKTKFLFSTLCAALLWHAAPTASADENGRARLQKAATGQEFTIAKTAFRLIPNAAVNKIEGAEADSQADEATVRSAAAGELARIGPYSISLGDSIKNSEIGKQSKAAAITTTAVASYGVAMNQRSGTPVLVTQRLRVYCKETTRADTLAKISGGKTVMVSVPARLIFLEYPTPAVALAALPLLKKQACVSAVEPEIVEAFPEPN